MPTIGYTVDGGTTDTGASGCVANVHASTLYTASGGEIVTAIHMYLGSLSAKTTVDVGIYEFTGGLPDLLVAPPAASMTISSTAGLYSVTGLSIPLASGKTYGVAAGVPGGNGRISYKYDLLSGNRRSLNAANNLPSTWTHAGYSSSQRSIFFDYTAGGTGYEIAFDSGAYSSTGQSAGLSYSRRIALDQGSFGDTGQAATLKVGRKLTISAGSFALTGQSAAVKASRKISIESGSFSLTGQSVAFGTENVSMSDDAFSADAFSTDAFALDADESLASLVVVAGSYVTTGNNVAFRRGFSLPAQPGAYADSGNAADLVYSGADNPDYTLVIGQGSYTQTGQAAALKASRKAAIAAGSYSDTGQATALRKTSRIAINQGSYADTGNSSRLVVQRLLQAAMAGYTYTGYAAQFGYYPSGSSESSITTLISIGDETYTVMLLDSTNVILLDSHNAVSV